MKSDMFPCLHILHVSMCDALLFHVICGIEEGNRYLAKRLSYDHRAEDQSEEQRIKDAGGFIARKRVLGILAVTRSFGDHGMKDFVTANPYISEIALKDCGDTPLLILGMPLFQYSFFCAYHIVRFFMTAPLLAHTIAYSLRRRMGRHDGR